MKEFKCLSGVAQPGDPGGLLAVTSLFARQFPDQLPELGERQLPVVVLVYGAHELVDHSGVAGVLFTEETRIRTPGIPEGSASWLTDRLCS